MLYEQETLSTLRFGQRAKQIKNVAKVNQDESVEGLKLTVEKLRVQLGLARTRVGQMEQLLKEKGLFKEAVLLTGWGAGVGGSGGLGEGGIAVFGSFCL